MKILDGGMGIYLRESGAPFKQPEWSALALIEAPETVKNTHRAYVDAGADIITTNSYALVPFPFHTSKFGYISNASLRRLLDILILYLY